MRFGGSRFLAPLLLLATLGGLALAGCSGGSGGGTGAAAGGGALTAFDPDAGGLTVTNAPPLLTLNGHPVRLVEAIGYDASGKEVWGGLEDYGPTMTFEGLTSAVTSVRLLYYRGPDFELGDSGPTPLGGVATESDPTFRVLSYAAVQPDALAAATTITAQIYNNSGYFDDDEVYLLLIGADANVQTKYLYLSQPSPGVYQMTEFDDSATTVLPRVNNAYVDRDGEPGTGSQKYSIRLSDMQPVLDKQTRQPIPHAYSFECPTTNLYHSIGFLSFGAPIRGTAIQANLYGAALPDTQVPASIPGVTLTAGSRTVTLSSAAHLYAGLEVQIASNGKTTTNTLQQVSADGLTLTLSKKVPAAFAGVQTLQFPNTVASWKQYPITQNVTATGKLGINTNIAEGTPGRYFLSNLTNDVGRHVTVGEAVASSGSLSGGGSFSGTVTGMPAGDQVFVSTFDASLQDKTGTFNFTVPNGASTINPLALAQPSAVSTGADFGTPFEFIEFTITDTTVFADASYVNAFTTGVTFTADYEDGGAGKTFTAGWPAGGVRTDILSDLYALTGANQAYQAWVYLDDNGLPQAYYGSNGTPPTPAAANAADRIVRVLSPSNAVSSSAALQGYFSGAIDAGWSYYASNPYRNAQNTNTVTINSMLFTIDLFTATLNAVCTSVTGTNTGQGEVYALPKPTSTDIFLQDTPTDPGSPYTNTWANRGTDAHKAMVQGATCAFNRGVFTQDWANATFYASDTCNQYSKILHRYALNDRIYALPYDDTFVPDSANPEFSAPIGNVNFVRYSIEPFK